MQNLNPFETYVSDLRGHLRFVNAAERQENVDEIRLHLDASLAVRLEDGEPVESATASVLEQFGPARAVSRRLLAAYFRRRLARLRYSYVGAIAALVGSTFLISILWDTVWQSGLSHILQDDSFASLVVINCAMFARCICLGWIVAWFAGKRAVPIFAIGWVMFYFVYIAPQLHHADMPAAIRLQTLLGAAGIVLSSHLGLILALRNSRAASRV